MPQRNKEALYAQIPCHALSWIVGFCHGKEGGERKKDFGKGVGIHASHEKTDVAETFR